MMCQFKHSMLVQGAAAWLRADWRVCKTHWGAAVRRPCPSALVPMSKKAYIQACIRCD